MEKKLVREFETGATRDSDEGKLDFEGFLSPSVMFEFSEYMDSHRIQSDGKPRDSDNWQKGIDEEAYIKSLVRHIFEMWALWRGCIARTKEGNLGPTAANKRKLLCAIMFNAQGMLHELLKKPDEEST